MVILSHVHEQLLTCTCSSECKGGARKVMNISHRRTSVTGLMNHSMNTLPGRKGNTLTVDKFWIVSTSILE